MGCASARRAWREILLGELLTHLNALLVTDTGGERFMTMLLVTIDAASRRLTWASAGHDPILLYGAALGRFVELEGGGLPLGVLEGETYEEYRHGALNVGDVLVLATDGLWEARDASGEMFGKERLQAVIAAHAESPAARIEEAIRAAHREFCGAASQADDITFVVVRVGA